MYLVWFVFFNLVAIPVMASSVVGVNRGNALESGAPPATPYSLIQDWSYGGRLEFDYNRESNYDLSEASADELVELQFLKPSLAFSWHPQTHWFGYVNFEFDKTLVSGDQNIPDPDTRILLDKAYVDYQLAENMRLRVGRQRIKDTREWMFDDTLDGVRLSVQQSLFVLDAAWLRERAFTENLLQSDPVEPVDYLWVRLKSPRGSKHKSAVWGLMQRDLPRNEEVFWLGMEQRGEWGDLDYWALAAIAKGDKRGSSIGGFGFDVGGVYRFFKQPRIYGIIGFASGSGDPDDVDLGFRQTDLQDNNAKLGGVTRFVFYGEVFDPELSNLSILSAGIAIRPVRDISVTLMWHNYSQRYALDELRESDLSVEPGGSSRDIGQEIDLVFGLRWEKRLRVEAVWGEFYPGAAFVDRDTAQLLKLQLRYNF